MTVQGSILEELYDLLLVPRGGARAPDAPPLNPPLQALTRKTTCLLGTRIPYSILAGNEKEPGERPVFRKRALLCRKQNGDL